MSLNSYELNSIPLNGGGDSAAGSGQLIALEQKVGFIGSGELIALEQEVQLYETGSGELVALTQSVETTASGTLITLNQRVRDITVPSHLTRTGWDLDVYVGSELLDKSKIIDVTDVIFEEGSSAIARIVLRGTAGSVDLDYYDGKSVVINAYVYSGSPSKINDDGVYRLFTGIVDITEFDIINEFIILNCVNERRKLINNNLLATVKTIGNWDATIFGSFKDTAEELDQRLQTVEYAADFDPYNNFLYTSWTPKSTADFTFADARIFTKAPRIERASAARIINKITLTMQYRYQRLHHRQRAFSWVSDADNNPCRILAEGYDMTRRDMITEAVKNAGWPVRGAITFTGPPSAGWYSCNGTYAALSYTTTTAQLTERTLYTGPSTPETPVLDDDGNQVYDPVTTGVINYNNVFCTTASWNATTRWAQTVQEDFTVTITAPQSISQFGTVEAGQTFGQEDDFDTSIWEDYGAYNNQSPNGDATYFLDQDWNESGFYKAFRIALDRARTQIRGSHRDTRVILTVPLTAGLNLGHTVATTATRLTCKGKVQKYTHFFNHKTTEAYTVIEVVLSRSTGSTTNQSLTIPARLNTDSAPAAGGTINLGNHFGEDPSQSGAENWTGFIGNKVVQNVKTNYLQAFIVDVPAIEDSSRKNKTLTSSTSYTISIPNDSLSVTFEGTSLA